MGSLAKAESGGKAQHVERIPVDRVCGTQGEMRRKNCRRKLVEVVCAEITSRASYIIVGPRAK